MPKIQIGDVFELETNKGLAYVQYCSLDNDGIEMIRILPGLYSDRPSDLENLVSQKELFSVQFCLIAAYRKKLVALVRHFAVPSDYETPTKMRTTHVINGDFLGWHIIEKETLHRILVTELSQEQVQLSPYGIWNDSLLKERLEENWNLEIWR